MTSPRLRLAASALIAATLLVGGCTTSQVSPQDMQPEKMSKPTVTAASHFAAGQFHENAIVRDPDKDVEKQLRDARKQAVKQYEKGLELDPNHAPTLFRLAALATEDQDVERAEDFWRRYVKATNNAPAGWRNLAISMDLLGETQKAEEAYRQTLASDGEDEVARINLGMLLARENRLAEARTELSMAMPPADVHFHIAQALRRKDRPDDAAREMRAAAAIDSRYATTDATPAE